LVANLAANPGLTSVDVERLQELMAQYPVLVIRAFSPVPPVALTCSGVAAAFGLVQRENYSAAGFALRPASFSSIAERMNLKYARSIIRRPVPV
jgi:hypothetical protein